MAITESELLFKYTGEGSTTDPSLSLGGTLGTNTIPSGVANNIFDDVTGDEAESGAMHFRAIGIHNSNTTHIWMNTSIRIDGYVRASNTPDVMYFGVEKPSGTGGSPEGTIGTIGSETIEPTWVSWTEEGTPSAWVQMSGKDYDGSIGPDDWCGIWLKRSIPPNAEAFSNRAVTIRVRGETSASPLQTIEAVFRLVWTKDRFEITRISGSPDLEAVLEAVVS